MSDPITFTDPIYFPRCEFYTRFQRTTCFAMKQPTYWNAYHRSQRARCFQSKEQSLFTSPNLVQDHKKGDRGYYAHTGGHSSPFKNDGYTKPIQGDQPLDSYDHRVRDELINYKNSMCDKVLQVFNQACDDQKINNSQPARRPRKQLYKEKRPIVIYENDYPCILVQLPIFNPKHNENNADKKAAAKYWSKHPKPLQKLLMSCFVGMIDVAAKKAGLPIEMVMRSSFCHNLPSVSETGHTFRINIGLVPEAYANLVGETLFLLYQWIDNINNDQTDDTSTVKLSGYLSKQIEDYNKNKLNEKISKNDRYQSLHHSNLSYSGLYQQFTAINQKHALKGGSRFVPIELKGTIWQVIRQPGNSIGGSLLTELFRLHAHLEQFTNMLMVELEKNVSNSLANVLITFINHYLDYSTGKASIKALCKADALQQQSKCKWRAGKDKAIADDLAFQRIVTRLFASLNAEVPVKIVDLYARLEQAHHHFIAHHCTDHAESGWGSDSDCEISCLLTGANQSNSTNAKLHGKKLRLNNGMSAIVLAHYLAQCYLAENVKAKNFYTLLDNMYYETGDALALTRAYRNLKNVIHSKIRDKANGILFHDLNYCNAANRLDVKTLTQQLHDSSPKVVVLDYTSAVTADIKRAVSLCFVTNTCLVLLVNSGLKNDQGGADSNPYGELRILSKNKAVKQQLYQTACRALEGSEAVPAAAHQIVRGYKKRGHVFRFDWLKDNTGATVNYTARSAASAA